MFSVYYQSLVRRFTINVSLLSFTSSPLGHHGDSVDHLAFLQEPMSDEDDELDVERVPKDSALSSQPYGGGEESRETSAFDEEQTTPSITGKVYMQSTNHCHVIG